MILLLYIFNSLEASFFDFVNVFNHHEDMGVQIYELQLLCNCTQGELEAYVPPFIGSFLRLEGYKWNLTLCKFLHPQDLNYVG